MIQPLDMLNLVEAQIQVVKLRELVEAFDVRDQVVVEVELLQGGAQGLRKFDRRDLILTEREALELLEPVQPQGGNRRYAAMDEVDLLCTPQVSRTTTFFLTGPIRAIALTSTSFS